jgi:purine-cytosine permease-like protein
VFRRRHPYDVLVWDTPSLLPPGIAAFVAWACGLTAALMGADQSWLVGPIAKAIGGADIGWELVSQITSLSSNQVLCLPISSQSAAVAFTVYVPSRLLELKFMDR